MNYFQRPQYILNALGQGLLIVDPNLGIVYANSLARKMLDSDPVGRLLNEVLPRAGAVAQTVLLGGASPGPCSAYDPEHKFIYRAALIAGEHTGVAISLQAQGDCAWLDVCQNSRDKIIRQLQAIFDSSSDGIWVSDGQGIVISINRASERLNNIDARHFIGHQAQRIVSEGLIDQSVTVEVLQRKSQVSMIQNIRRTGKQLLVTGTPVFDENGELCLVVVNERDVTELNNLRASLEKVRRDKEKVQDKLVELTMLECSGSEIIAESRAMQQVLTLALKLARLNASEILLLGESGTGKGLVAKLIHQAGPRKDKPFLQINCAALPQNLFEAELFGYERGAFTGASEQGKAGLLELAQDGTFFLDEIGEMPVETQAKLLKCLDDHEFIPLGGKEPRKMRCNIIAATNRDLEDLVRRKRFRKDLYYRLNTFIIRIPPLRERAEDIFELACLYLRRFNEQYGSSKRFTHRAVRLLTNYPYPGNVRELIGIIKKAVVMCEDRLLDSFLEQMLSGSLPVPEETDQGTSLPEQLDRLERELLLQARTMCSSTREMATFLGISQPTVVRKLRKHNLVGADSEMHQD